VIGAGGVKIQAAEALRRLIRKHQPGDTMKLEILRQGKRMELEVKLTEQPR
jgi:S1-C subfamily serine protease